MHCQRINSGWYPGLVFISVSLRHRRFFLRSWAALWQLFLKGSFRLGFKGVSSKGRIDTTKSWSKRLRSVAWGHVRGLGGFGAALFDPDRALQKFRVPKRCCGSVLGEQISVADLSSTCRHLKRLSGTDFTWDGVLAARLARRKQPELRIDVVPKAENGPAVRTTNASPWVSRRPRFARCGQECLLH